MKNNFFKHIPNRYKPIPFWSWNDKLSSFELLRQIEEFKEKGYGGFFMHSRVGLVTGYMSQEWMNLIKECINKAKELKIDAWLYDEDKWPSGFAGGEVPLANRDFCSRNLLLLRREEITQNDTPISQYNQDGICFYVCKRVEGYTYKHFNNTCYIDTMNSEAVGEFIKKTHEKYKKNFGKYFGNTVPGIFTDEPAYHMYNLTTVPSLPWSEKLPDFFYKMHGYNLCDNVISLFFEVGNFKKIRYDFFKAASKLFLESYTIQYSKWCKKNNIKMTGHYMFEDEIGKQIKFIGHAMPHYVHMDIPGVDKLRKHIEQFVTIKQLASVKEQFAKEQALCEIFGCIGQNSSFAERKWIADWAAVLGISLFNSHLSLYSMRGERKRDYPPNLFFQQPWWNEEGEFSDYIARISALASLGKSDTKILIIHPIESGWCVYSAYNARRGLPDGTEVYNIVFEQLSKAMLDSNIAFHYGDEEIIEGNACINNGNIKIGEMVYSCVIIPKCLTLRKTTVELLKDFKGDIISVAGTAYMTDGEDIPPEINYTQSFFKVPEAIKYLIAKNESNVTITDNSTGKLSSSIWSSRRLEDENEYIFFVNTDPKREVHASISFATNKIPYIIDLNSGNLHTVSFKRKEKDVLIDATFFGAGSMAVLLSEESAEFENIDYLKSGVCFNNFYCKEKLLIPGMDILEENVLPLQKIDLEIDGKTVIQNKHISNVWHNYFYNSAEGTPFSVTYKFDIETLPQGEICAVIEVAENLDLIEINGQKVTPFKKKGDTGVFDEKKSWKDVNFTKVYLKNYLKTGSNTLKIYGKKSNNIIELGEHLSLNNSNDHFPTEAETAYIIGNFKVNNIDNTYFSITQQDGTITSTNLTDSGYPFYGGRAKCSFSYTSNIDKEVLFKISNPHFSSAQILVNGKECDVLYSQPYIFKADMKCGENIIEIIISTTLYNLMGPNWNIDFPESVFTGPVQFVENIKYSDKLSFLPFGLEGIYEITMKRG